MKKGHIIGVAVLAIIAISCGLYSYFSPDIWLRDVKKAAQEGDKERLQDLIDFDTVKSGLKEDIKTQVVISMGTELGDNPFAAVGLAMASMLVDPMVEMIVSPSGMAALIEKGRVPSPNKGKANPTPSSIKKESSYDGVSINHGYDSFSRYRIRIRSPNKETEEPIVLTLKREGIFSWKLARVALPSNLMKYLPQRPTLISIEASDMRVVDPGHPNVIHLTATLRNQAKYALGYPALDLVLTNNREHTLARRIFVPADYLERGKDVEAGFVANAEITIRLNLDTGTLGAAGFRLNLVSDTADVERLQIAPEKIQLISLGDSASANPKSAKSGVACLEWGPFSGGAVARADAAIAGLNLPASQINRVTVDASAYWVYISPLKSSNEAEKSVKALRELGVTDYSVVQEQTQWRNAISLGVFRNDESAQEYLKSLQRRGVTNAIAEKRENFLKQVVFYVREPNERTVAKLAALRATLPASEIRAAPCPPAGEVSSGLRK